MHQHNIGSLDGRIGTHGAHGNSHIGTAENGGIIDSVSRKGQLLSSPHGRKELFHLLYLVRRKKLAVKGIHPQLRAYLLRRGAAVAGQHHQLLHALFPERRDGLRRGFFYGIRNPDIAGVSAACRHMDDGSRILRILTGNSQLLHKLPVSGRHGFSVHQGAYAVASQLFDVLHAGKVRLFSMGSPDTLADGMGRCALRQGRTFQQLFL